MQHNVATIFFNRQIKTLLPGLLSVKRPAQDELIRKRDTEAKQAMKLYADDKRHAKESSLDIGDQVRVRNPKTFNQHAFNPEIHTISAKKGTMISAIGNQSGVSITRNVSFFTRVVCLRDQKFSNMEDEIIIYDHQLETGAHRPGTIQVPPSPEHQQGVVQQQVVIDEPVVVESNEPVVVESNQRRIRLPPKRLIITGFKSKSYDTKKLK